MSDLLLDTPWWLPTTIFAIGLLVFLTGNKRVGDAPRGASVVRNVGLGFMAAALLLVALSYFVDTSKETVAKRTRLLVQSVELRDWEKLKSLLADDVRFSAGSIGREYASSEELTAAAKTTSELVGLNEVRLTAIDAREIGGSTISVQIQVFSDTNKTAGQKIPTEWVLEWQKRPGKGWVTTDIRLTKFGNLSEDAIRSQLPK